MVWALEKEQHSQNCWDFIVLFEERWGKFKAITLALKSHWAEPPWAGCEPLLTVDGITVDNHDACTLMSRSLGTAHCLSLGRVAPVRLVFLLNAVDCSVPSAHWALCMLPPPFLSSWLTVSTSCYVFKTPWRDGGCIPLKPSTYSLLNPASESSLMLFLTLHTSLLPCH